MLDFVNVRNALVAVVLVSSAVLSGCNNEDAVAKGKALIPGNTAGKAVAPVGTAAAPAGTAAAPAGTAANSAGTTATSGTMSISGSSATSVRVGEAYTFQPSVAGAGAAVGFSIQNKPAWATFDTVTGALKGTPSIASVGTYANIVISASSSGGGNAALAAFSLSVTQVVASTGSATLSWTPPTQNTDGSAIVNLAGYRIYYGASEGALTNSINVTNPGLTAYTVADLKSGTTYFGITAYTTGGAESGMSNVGSKTIM